MQVRVRRRLAHWPSFPVWRTALMALGLGVLMASGLAPLGFWWLALPALVLLVRLGLQGTAKHAGWIGWLGGVGYFGAGLNWIVEPFMVDAAHDGWMAPFALVFMATGMALFWALGFGLGARFPRRAAGLVVGLTGAEFLRGYALTGFPWALPSHIWIDTPVAQVDSLVGPFGLTLLTLAAAALAAPLTRRGLGFGFAMLAAGWLYGDWVLAQPDPAPKGVTLRLVQPNAPQDAKWDPDHAQFFFDRLMAATSAPSGAVDTGGLSPGTNPVPPAPDAPAVSPSNAAAAPAAVGKVDLVIWPETALPYLVENDPELPALIAGGANGVPVALGLQRVERDGDTVRGFNSLHVFGPGGALVAAYDKHHLVPFGEYIPLGDLAYAWFGIGDFASQTGNAYTAGPGPAVLDLGVRLGKVLPLICYEAVFPQDLRGTARADWILQVTNDAWFGTLSGPFQHAAQARLRAIEQGLPLARVANTGVTEMIDARGRVTASLPFDTDGYLDAALPGALPAPLYARFGEIPALMLLAALALLAIRRQSAPSA